MVTKPTWGVMGIPAGSKETGRRTDFKFELFETLLETKGYRMAWRRAAPCPCVPVNDQTDSPDPNCALCRGTGWLYFGTTDPFPAAVGILDDVQQAIVGSAAGEHAAVIRAIQTGLTERPDVLDRQGRWIAGETVLTVRAENQLGYYDRLVNLDAQMVFAEILTAGDGTTLAGRYPMTGINLLRTETAVLLPEVDYTLQNGRILWVGGHAPTSGARLVCHYLCHPTWLVVDHPHVVRASLLKRKVAAPTTPQGDFRSLPLQAHVKLEFLP